MKIMHSSLSRLGGRKVNEDAHGQNSLSEDTGCWVVADGLGGHGGGDVASKSVVEMILQLYRRNSEFSTKRLEELFTSAQQELLLRQEDEPRLSSMRSTAVVLLVNGNRGLWAYIGDTRLYHFHHGRIVRQTQDHSVPQAMVDAGKISKEDIRHHDDRNRLLRSLGNEGKFRLSTLEQSVLVTPGDAFLLCTDGFWEYVLETEMEVSLVKSDTPESWLRSMEILLLGRAPAGHDNYTASALFLE